MLRVGQDFRDHTDQISHAMDKKTDPERRSNCTRSYSGLVANSKPDYTMA